MAKAIVNRISKMAELDEEIEETVVAPASTGIALDKDEDNCSVAIASNEVITLYISGGEQDLSIDEANRLVDKLSWALQAASALSDRVPF
jgi:hypothetical protein